jgi:osmotically-inducible protein OsmY
MKTKLLIFASMLFGLSSFAKVSADYTTVPKVDRAERSMTKNPSVLDQSSGTKQDVEVTRHIREELGKTDLSTAAKNVDVITLGNVVTLRGAVASEYEKQKVYDTALNAAGSRTVNNELVIDSAKR